MFSLWPKKKGHV